MKLRYYQRDAVDSLHNYLLTNKNGNPLVVCPTGTGKAFIIAQFIEEVLKENPRERIINCIHTRELVSQNYVEFMGISPFAPAGIYSAGLNRRDSDAQILFCGIQSVYKKAYDLQWCDLLIIDEAHSIPQKGSGMWLSFITDLMRINPKMRVVGLTATDYRMDSGLLTTGEGKIFDDVCYEYTLLRALEDGYLCPIIPTNMETKFDLSNVGMLGGEYKQNELEAAFNIDAKTFTAMDEVESFGVSRNSWLIFAAGNNHAEKIHAELQRRLYSGAVVTQKTSRADRDDAVKKIRTGEIRYIVNNRVFTTGFNAKNIDMIADFAATKSGGLHVQKLGRGMRCLGVDITESTENGKKNCLLLDFARNVEYHGPLDKIRGKDKRKSEGGETPMKVCPSCDQVCFAGLRKCFCCGYDFPENLPEIHTTGGTAAVLSTQIEPEWIKVNEMCLGVHTKKDKPPSMRVDYYSFAIGKFSEWVCFEHTGFARRKAEEWHMARRKDIPIPANINEAVNIKYPKPSMICVKKEGQYSRIVDYEFNGEEDEEFEIPF